MHAGREKTLIESPEGWDWLPSWSSARHNTTHATVLKPEGYIKPENGPVRLTAPLRSDILGRYGR